MAPQSRCTCHSIIKTNGAIPPACIASPVLGHPANEAVSSLADTPTSPLIFSSHRQLPSSSQFTDVHHRAPPLFPHQHHYHHRHHHTGGSSTAVILRSPLISRHQYPATAAPPPLLHNSHLPSIEGVP
ncbi:hypothetical protein E2C01_064126 [Portunus trituberculatus]|uniref:Uncharacterized protein n=1 Tax=Portunus trituberculatus TaxID=210409 RepID=A0A5B7HMW4_PORTR|nr:hypothetical protein [Portunus trituberculatus]